MQPEELDGIGSYTTNASVMSPALNVLCINAAGVELEPLVYETWPKAEMTERNGELTPWGNWEIMFNLVQASYT